MYIPKFFGWLIYIYISTCYRKVTHKFKKFFWNDSYLFTVLGSGVPCLNPQHQAMPKTSNSLPNKITRSFWLPHLAAILAFTAETWLSLSASMWKSSSKRRKIVRSRSQTHACWLPRLRLRLKWMGTARAKLYQQRELILGWSTRINKSSTQPWELNSYVSVEKKQIQLYLPSIPPNLPNFCPSLSALGCFFQFFVFGAWKNHHPSPRPSHKCWKTSPSNLQLHFQLVPRFSPPLSVPLVLWRGDDYSEMWNSKMVEKLKNQRRHWLQQIEQKLRKTAEWLWIRCAKIDCHDLWRVSLVVILRDFDLGNKKSALWACPRSTQGDRSCVMQDCKTVRFWTSIDFFGGPRGSLAIFIIWDSMWLCRLYRLPRHKCDGRFSVARST